jgi:hypothetical protein
MSSEFSGLVTNKVRRDREASNVRTSRQWLMKKQMKKKKHLTLALLRQQRFAD